MTNRRRMLFPLLAVIASALALTTYAYRSTLRPYVAGFFSRGPAEMEGSGTPPRAKASSPEQIPRAPVDIDMRRQQLIGVRTVAARRALLYQTIRTAGLVRYDETRQTDVNVKLEGWIRDLFVDYTGQTVRKGQPLFTFYSPQVLTAESEYLLALKSRDQMQQSQIADARDRADQLVSAARQRLALWDVSPDELTSLDRTRAPHSTISVSSPATGFVVDKQAVQGMHVMPGQTLYKIADVSVVWVEADVYETEMSLMRVGQAATVTLDAYPGAHYLGRVIYIYPYVDEHTRTNKVRYELANRDGRLKPGMYATVEINAALAEGIVVPSNAVLDSGKEQIVFVAQGNGRFDPRTVKMGRRTGENVEILDGVKEGEQVATSAAFFLDSESQLRGSLESYTPGTSVQPASGPAAPQPDLNITFRTIPDPPKAGENQFEVVVKDASGKTIDDAQVEVQFFMAAMPTMNMPAMRNVVSLSPAGGGAYRGTGQIMMVGRWDTTVNITRNGQRIGSKQIPVMAQ
jgi:membrane fusion protein, copper/silver efflux system